MSDTVTLTVNGIPHELPPVTGTEGGGAMGISKLHSTTDLITLGDAYSNTGSYNLAITLIDDEHGILRCREVSTEDLASRSSFIKMAELLIFGDLPDDDERDELRQPLIENSALHRDIRRHLNDLPVDAHPMTIFSAMINAIQTYDLLEIHIAGEVGFRRATALPLAKIRTIAAASYKSHTGQPIAYSRYDLPYTENFLYAMFTVPYRDYEATPEATHALDMLFVFHADYEQNCSTLTMWIVVSSGANLLTAVSAGVTALWGPLYDEANMGVIGMLEQIHNEGMSVGSYLAKIRDQKSGVQLMGFGYRVYRNFDPHAGVLKRAVYDLLESTSIDDPPLDIARGVEEVALADDYFAERRLYPDVDFYPGITLWAIGIPLDMSTVLFAIGRTAGWIVHWKEANDDPAQRVCRPCQLYTGNELTKWLSLDER